MPGGFPLGLEVCNGTVVGFTPASTGTTQILASASANTKGGYTQIVASTAADTVFMQIDIIGFHNVGKFGALDLAIGAAGSEQIIVSNLMLAATQAGVANTTYLFPIQIPAGTAISARCQCDDVSDGMFVCLRLFDGAFTHLEGIAGIDSIGALASATAGTQIDPGATPNTLGAYAQLTASTPRDYGQF